MRSSLVGLLAASIMIPLAAHAAPLAGRWDGVFHGGRGDQAVTLVCRPGDAGVLTGLLYMSGDLVGPLENGHIDGDSLRFNVMNFACRAFRQGEQMSVELIVAHGTSHELSLRFASPDTATLAQSPEALAAARARTIVAWDQVPDSVFAKHHLAAATPLGIADAMRAGTLLLVGGGPAQEDVNAEFVRLAGGASGHIVVIPAPAVDPGKDAEALAGAERWARALGVPHVTVLHTSSRKEADSDAFVRPLLDATGVWLPGGEAGRILVSYLGTRTERELVAVLARGGVIGGTSAGALVWGSEVLTFRAPKDGSPYQMGNADALRLDDPHAVGFGALRQVVIAPHFTEFRMQPSLVKAVATRPQLLGIGIDEASALEVHGTVGAVLGRGHVTVVSAGSTAPQVLSAGTRYDIVRHAVL
jgi:cyanophycinase